jgi:hypothetical protein
MGLTWAYNPGYCIFGFLGRDDTVVDNTSSLH